MANPKLDTLYAGTSNPSGKVFGAHLGFLPEILIMIIEESLITSPTIANLRLVSKQFNDLVLPMMYRRVVLHSRIVDFNTFGYKNETLSSYKIDVVRNIMRYAQHITVRDDVRESALHKLLLSLTSFRTLSLRYDDRISVPVFRQTNSPTSTDAFLLCLARLKRKWPKLRIYIEILAMDEWQLPQMQALYTFQIVSLKIHEWSAGYQDPELVGLVVKQLLLSMRQLKVLHLASYENDVTISESNISATDRLPALEELVLNGYEWQLSPTAAITFWDWTKITHLELWRVPIIPFFRTVTIKNLLHLRTFLCDSESDHQAQEWDEANDLLCEFVRLVLVPEKLGIVISCGSDTVYSSTHIADCVRAMTAHWQSLRSLSLLEHWTSRADHRHKELVRDLKSNLLSLQTCSNLMELTLDDMMLGLQLQPEFAADTLAQFRNLRRLEVDATFFGDMNLETREETIDKTKATTLAWRTRLLARKLGAKFERIVLFVGVLHQRLPGALAPLVQSLHGGGFERDVEPRCIARLQYIYGGGGWREKSTSSIGPADWSDFY